MTLAEGRLAGDLDPAGFGLPLAARVVAAAGAQQQADAAASAAVTVERLGAADEVASAADQTHAAAQPLEELE